MSNYYWIKGEYKLPSAAVKPIRDAAIAAHNSVVNRAFAITQEFWAHGAKRTKSVKRYGEALRAFEELTWRDDHRPLYVERPHADRDVERCAREMASDLLSYQRNEPRRVKKADLAGHFALANTRTKRFGGPGFGFDIDANRLLRYSENGKAGHDDQFTHPVQRALFAQLEKVKWTRGTGGHMWSNDELGEYADRDNGYDSTRHYDYKGPLGEQQEADRTGMTVKQVREKNARLARPRLSGHGTLGSYTYAPSSFGYKPRR